MVFEPPAAVVELVADDGHDEVLPETVRDALFEADDPLPALDVQRVFPHRPAHARVEEQVVRRRLQRRRRHEVCPERPERLDLQVRGKKRSVLRTRGAAEKGRTELKAAIFLMPSS